MSTEREIPIESTPSTCTVPRPREKDSHEKMAEFELGWKPPSLLRPEQKKKLKQYYSLKQGRDGTRALCCFCNKEFGIQDLEIHHKDHKRINNQLSNLELACGPCNRDERAQWMAAYYAQQRSVITAKEKENTTESETLAQADRSRLIKQAPLTTQMKIRYKQQALEYLIEYVKYEKDFDLAVADVEALTGCSHQKAIEYLDSFSRSSFSPWRQWQSQAGQRIAPRDGWNAAKYATEEYKQAMKAVRDRQVAEKSKEQTAT